MQSSHSLLQSSALYEASQFGAIYFTHEPNSTTDQGVSYGSKAAFQCRFHKDHYTMPEECGRYKGLGYVIRYVQLRWESLNV